MQTVEELKIARLCQIPEFLIRPRTDETRTVADAIIASHGSARVWAPIKKIEDIRREQAAMEAPRVWVADPSLPVQVVTTRRENLQLHDNFAAFSKNHDFEDYPVKKVADTEGMTFIVVKAQAVMNGLSESLKDIERVQIDVVEQNGVKRPKQSSITGIAWATFDSMQKDSTDFKVVFEKLKENGMNPSTIRTQFAHWRKFNGISK